MVRFETANETINYHQYLHVQVTRDVFFHQPVWSKNMRKSNRITLPKDRDKTYASCQAPPQCKWILSTEATFPLPRNFRGSISFSPREIFFFTVKGQVEVTSPKKSCEPKSFFFGGGSKIVSFTESIPLQEIKQSTLVTPHISGDLVFFGEGFWHLSSWKKICWILCHLPSLPGQFCFRFFIVNFFFGFSNGAHVNKTNATQAQIPQQKLVTFQLFPLY